jgi:prepilin-type N-terminal cleavage/methylation domain-containing protein
MKKGFTLIELLVVIAIIGILSTIVLAFLSGARNSSKDAAIKQQLNSLKTEIELNYSSTGVYGPAGCGDIGGQSCISGECAGYGVFDTSVFNPYPKITSIINSTWKLAGSGNTALCKVSDTGREWAVAVNLPSDSSGNTWWCVDSTNTSHMVVDPEPIDQSVGTSRAICN